MAGVGLWEMLALGLVVLLVFGPKRLPEMGRSLGRGMREFKNSIGGDTSDDANDGLTGDPLGNDAAPSPRQRALDNDADATHPPRIDEREVA